MCFTWEDVIHTLWSSNATPPNKKPSILSTRLTFSCFGQTIYFCEALKRLLLLLLPLPVPPPSALMQSLVQDGCFNHLSPLLIACTPLALFQLRVYIFNRTVAKRVLFLIFSRLFRHYRGTLDGDYDTLNA